MANFVIAGKPDCGAFVHAVHVARYLAQQLPHFNINIIQKRSGDWEPWLEQINYDNRWYHSTSPVIWKELSMRGGIAHYLGGLSQFWEYVYDYYGLESVVSPEDLENMIADNLQFFEEMEKKQAEQSKNIAHVSIVGLNNEMLKPLLCELIELTDLHKSCGIQIQLLDITADQEETMEIVEDIIDDLEPLTTNGILEVLIIADRIQDVVTDCDLLIVLGDYNRRADEMESDWLTRNMSFMFLIADEVNVFAKRNMRIILAIDGPICFDANILADTCTGIRIQNIVAVTSDIGLGPLQCAAKQANVALEELSAPPVWGYVGINQFIDLHSAVIRSDIYRPYQRVIRNNGGSTLPLGTIQAELRHMAYKIEDLEEILVDAGNIRKTVVEKLDRMPVYSKLRSLVSLLKLWYAKEPSDNIISLGVCSNGAHELPTGIVFSQPVILEKGVWVPFKNFPLTEKAKQKIEELLPPVMEIIDKMRVGPCSFDFSFSDSYDYCP